MSSRCRADYYNVESMSSRLFFSYVAHLYTQSYYTTNITTRNMIIPTHEFLLNAKRMFLFSCFLRDAKK